ncbi:stage III sporulation protein SpoIIIAB [Neobacillus mesonae]|uniref:stage III sporulation protein SpoIIIAB n=1 Tax=Neobacillus mesonae TaxID=1193713 RepID=UPI002041F73C|nr:stage III sporulation protein SpoIIIAB [Neobacillus mesonae]MCM3566653.1 stage III sporulation protein SpoIIIAB [Neobacillus mesonae]
MVKLIGAIFILVATTVIGFEASRRFSDRPQQLRYLRSALQSLEAEIMYGHTPLHEAARRLSAQLSKPLSGFFDSFARKLTNTETTVKEAWETSLREVWKSTALKKGEFEIMKQFGETLGRHDRFSQQKQIMLTLSHLEREEANAVQAQMKYEKMVKSLGFLTGLLLIILLF